MNAYYTIIYIYIQYGGISFTDAISENVRTKARKVRHEDAATSEEPFRRPGVCLGIHGDLMCLMGFHRIQCGFNVDSMGFYRDLNGILMGF